MCECNALTCVRANVDGAGGFDPASNEGGGERDMVEFRMMTKKVPIADQSNGSQATIRNFEI